MAQRHHCVSIFLWIHTVLSWSQPLSRQRRYSETSVHWRYLCVIFRCCNQSCYCSQSQTLITVQDHEPRPSTRIPRHQNPPRYYLNQPQSVCLYRHNPRTIRHGAYSRCLDTHWFHCKVGLRWGSGGEGTGPGRYHRLSSSRGITNGRSTCNSARYLICGQCSVSLHFMANQQP